MCAAGEPDVLDGGDDVCGDADDDGVSELVVRGAVEPGWLRILPERSNDDLSGIPDRDGNTAAETGQDGDDGGDAGVRHERRRRAGIDGGAG